MSNASEVKADAAGLDKTPVTPRSTTSIAEVDTAFHQHVSTWYSQSQNDSIALDSSETYQWLFPAHTNNSSHFYTRRTTASFCLLIPVRLITLYLTISLKHCALE